MSRANGRKKRACSRNDGAPCLDLSRAIRSGNPIATCRQEVDFLSLYLSAGLNARERVAFENHLGVCVDCVAFLKTYKTTVALTKSFLSSRTRANGTARPSLKLGRKPVIR